MKKFTSQSQKTGQIGEDVACKFLVKHGFSIVERNYTKKWGEIDIVARKGNTTYFVEVKASVLRETPVSNVSRATTGSGTVSGAETVPDPVVYRPEENVHPWKLKRFSRAVQSYLAEKGFTGNWQVDVLLVWLDLADRTAKVRVIENVILEG